MSRKIYELFLFLFFSFTSAFCCGFEDEPVLTAKALQFAVKNRPEGSTILLGPGRFELTSPLQPKPGMSLKGSGKDKTVVTNHPDWKPSTKTLPDPEVKVNGLDSFAYLIRLPDKGTDISISAMTLSGPHVHGAIFGDGNENLNISRVRIKDFLYSGVRVFKLKKSIIDHCEFIDAGGRWKRGGIPGKDGGISGGAIFGTWMQDVEISHNRFGRTKTAKEFSHFGIKGRGGRRIHIHHNTIDVNFSIEFPFEGADSFEIHHNVLNGAISIPKYAGGKVPESGITYDIHHNYMTKSYSIEFVRNGVKIHHNLFDFDPQKDGGNLISAFGKAPAKGPAEFHNNLVSNPGRGVIWMNEPYDNLLIRNNHIIARQTRTPRKEGLFGFNPKSDFGTIQIVDNIIECRGLARPLFRNDLSYRAKLSGNQLENISESERIVNAKSDSKPGLQAPLLFSCGVDQELRVDGWTAKSRAPK